MNPQKAAAAYRLISQGFAQLAAAIDTPASPAAPAAGSAHPAPDTFESGAPVPLEPLSESDFDAVLEATGGEEVQPSLAEQSVEFRPPRQTVQDEVLGECPVHFRPWTVREGGISRNGKPYKAFWKCNGKNPDGTFCDKKPAKEWVRTHDPEKALAAA